MEAKSHSKSRSPSVDYSLEMLPFEQDLSECVERNPVSPISASVIGMKKLPEPSWGRHKYTAKIKELSDESSWSDEEEAAAVANDRKKPKKVMARRRSRSKSKRRHQRERPKVIFSKNTRNFNITVTAEKFNDPPKESIQKRAKRLQFESKRKAYYSDEGIAFKKYHAQHQIMLPENLVLTSSSSSSSNSALSDYFSSSSESLAVCSLQMKREKFENSRRIQEEKEYLKQVISSSSSKSGSSSKKNQLPAEKGGLAGKVSKERGAKKQTINVKKTNKIHRRD